MDVAISQLVSPYEGTLWYLKTELFPLIKWLMLCFVIAAHPMYQMIELRNTYQIRKAPGYVGGHFRILPLLITWSSAFFLGYRTIYRMMHRFASTMHVH